MCVCKIGLLFLVVLRAQTPPTLALVPTYKSRMLSAASALLRLRNRHTPLTTRRRPSLISTRPRLFHHPSQSILSFSFTTRTIIPSNRHRSFPLPSFIQATTHHITGGPSSSSPT